MTDSTISTSDRASSKRRLFRLVVGLLLVAGCVVYVIFSTEAQTAIQSVAGWILVAMIVMQVAYVLTDAVRNFAGIPTLHRQDVPFWDWTYVFLVGRMLNTFVPQSGTAFRAAALRRRWNLPVSTYLMSLVLVTWVGNGMLMVGVGLVLLGVGRSEPWLGPAFLAAGVAVVAIVVIGERYSGAVRLAGPDSTRRQGVARQLLRLVAQTRLDSSNRGRVIVGSLAMQVAGFSIYWVVLTAFGLADAPLRALVLYAASTISTFLSLTPAGLGVTELSSALVGSAVSVPAAISILVVLVVRLSGIIGTAVLSAVLAMVRGNRNQ